ncbi:HlyD family secretion protein [Pseudomonas capsici]|uniref:HlyD family efflux transporter periplasmic adaptor subunit n=1 Tax=Pseudomonas capsici TaxID=2810614 RepID=A0ABT3BYZ3_9PSED|nr:HlyD family efflux transporter periplasmic adaptor subunit [Pseudomonas capsici]MBN6715802.1 HlyD family efflux transporter periplasmic adaptor subunit [Pseudomonas capsici]MBN6720946.1 HlyD family efflux transporter periplasmic adaptor subunit [Pseudomonas capsici]MBN6725704.1 HlyD family efflux transporter periplasmic adaptor subunit [Pseudomonas capsici]MCV4270033.1 HlyD family efflux transporter periplasmic adaptor subunit [Pseudomonas capsici]MCV4279718.1 HlyD family efflux transporter
MLFRPEALDAQKRSTLGTVLLVSPLSMRLAAAVSLLFCICMALFLTFATYTKRTAASGVLLPENGLIRIYAPQAGVVNSLDVAEGQPVNTGAVLMALSSDTQNGEAGGSQQAISLSIKRRLESLTREIDETLALHRQELDGKKRQVEALETEQQKILAQIDLTRQRLALTKGMAERYADLQRQDYVSRDQLQEKEDAVLDMRLRGEELNRSLLTVRAESTRLRAELVELPFNQSKQMAELQRRLAESQDRLIESETKREVLITAPTTGEATAIAVSNGSRVDSARPLLSIVPADANLHAELYLPSRSVGFVSAGDTVMLRYQAYPYQRFGLQPGTVSSISRTALPAEEVMTLGNVSEQSREQGPFYRVTVALASQTIEGQDVRERLRSGMQLDADIMQEKLPLYEWLLEPLRGIGKRL